MSDDLPMRAEHRVSADVAGGRASALLWWSDVPKLPGERLGVIGGFEATGAAAAQEVLLQACRELGQRRCTLAVGPMDGNTWRRYRFVTEQGEEPPFFLEPTNPPPWPRWWEQAGFAPLARYTSAVTDDLTPRDPRLESVRARVAAAGIRLRSLDPANFEAELDRIHDVSAVAFVENYLYSPLPRAEFAAQYLGVRPLVRPELVRLAERDGRPVGYMFAIPDQAQAQRGEKVTNVIMKTIAVRPECGGLGLGTLLFAEVHAAAGRLGFRRAIHALMHEKNASQRMSAHYARRLRGYALYGRKLAS